MASEWFYAQSGQQVGPVTEDELRQRARAGEIGPADLVWRDGMPDWAEAQTVGELAEAFQGAGGYDLAPAPVATPWPAGVGGAAPAAAYGTPAPAVIGYGSYAPTYWTVKYAGFWIRFVAAFLDGLITGVAGAIVGGVTGFMMGFLMAGSSTQQQIELAATVIGQVLGLVIGWLYDAFFTASSYQATPGKLAMGIRVTDLQGNRITFGRATGRHFAKLLSGLICAIGYIVAAFDERKRALHDQLAGTLVIYKPQ